MEETMEKLTGNFAQVPKEAARAIGGPFGLYTILSQYQELSKSKGHTAAFPGQETLAKEFGVSERTIRAWTRTLEEMGYLTVDRRGKRVVNNYFVHATPIAPVPDTIGDRKDVAGHEGDRKESSGHEMGDRKQSTHGDRKESSGVTGSNRHPSNTESTNTESKTEEQAAPVADAPGAGVGSLEDLKRNRSISVFISPTGVKGCSFHASYEYLLGFQFTVEQRGSQEAPRYYAWEIVGPEGFLYEPTRIPKEVYEAALATGRVKEYANV
jgi:hypothetical protein